jgi:hypothetical protein
MTVMGSLPAAELLDVWERGCETPEPERALALLEASAVGASRDELAQLTVGARNTRLLTLRERLFGADITAVADCPACGNPAEMALDVGRLRVTRQSEQEDELPTPAVEHLTIDGYEIAFRLPNGVDLGELPPMASVDRRREALLGRCILHAQVDGMPVPAAELPESLIGALETRMDELDPNADVRLSLRCPLCSEEWVAGFAIADFLWADIDHWAWRTLGEVHALAQAYGWSEDEILTMSPVRRQRYLELVDQ